MDWLETFSQRALIRAIAAINFLIFCILAVAMLRVLAPGAYAFLASYFAKIVVWWLWASTLLLIFLLILALAQKRMARLSRRPPTGPLVAEILLVFGWLLVFGLLLLVSRIFAPSL
jgi:hypothetical protein